MRQIDTVLAGERDYAKIRGGTGPLVCVAERQAGRVFIQSATRLGTSTRMRHCTGSPMAAAIGWWPRSYSPACT